MGTVAMVPIVVISVSICVICPHLCICGLYLYLRKQVTSPGQEN